MDAAVIASMARWPNVPDCYGWLHLDAQGRWRIGELTDDKVLPNLVEHAGLNAFINRNYLSPKNSIHSGAWALQNGAQRVWVNLALAPLIVQLHDGIATAHTQQTLKITRVFLSDTGVVYFDTTAGGAALASTSMLIFSNGLNTIKLDEKPILYWQQSPTHSPLRVIEQPVQIIEQQLGFIRCPISP